MSHARAYSIKDRPSKENEKELKKQLLGSINLMEKKKNTWGTITSVKQVV